MDDVVRFGINSLWLVMCPAIQTVSTVTDSNLWSFDDIVNDTDCTFVGSLQTPIGVR